MSKKIYYNKSKLYDTTIPDNERLQTAILLKKSTYKQIEEIKSKMFLCSSRPQIIEVAVNFLLKSINLGKYDEIKDLIK